MRIDNYLVEKKYFLSRTKAKQAIEKGEIFLDEKQILKSSEYIDESKEHNYKRVFIEDYVSLGGFKLSKALKDFSFSVENFICADIGASTGGFTDCLLQNGAKKVYAIDLNDTLLADKLKNDVRVVTIIKNAKDLEKNVFFENLDFICADLSFISETLILPVISRLLDKNKHAIVLIKPQFEMEKRVKCKNGIIKDNNLINYAIEKVTNCASKNNFISLGVTKAPNSQEKNKEYLVLLKKV